MIYGVFMMKFINKIKNKLFPEEEEILYYQDPNKAKKENRMANKLVSDDKEQVSYKPESFVNTQEIADTLKNGHIVVLDISLLDRTEALRMIDFLGGVLYALNGDMKRINKTTFEFSINSKEKKEE